MATIKLFISNARMLDLMDYVIQNHVRKTSTQYAFCESIGAAASIIADIRSGKKSFTIKHIHTAAKIYKININWLFGLEENMFRTAPKVEIESLLKSALQIVKTQKKQNL